MRPSNRLGLNYHDEATRFAKLPYPIFDVHSHINGERASVIFRQAAEEYGVRRVYSMTMLEQIPEVRAGCGDLIRFIAVPDFSAADLAHSFGPGFSDRIRAYHAQGARIAKFWAAPRIIDFGAKSGELNLFRLNSPLRMETMKVAQDLGMYFMAHVGDPNTWFATKYSDVARYGSKASHYEAFEEALDRFRVPWIAAHMGGYPEDLAFLSRLLERYSHLHLDCSATKWQVRELSKHPRADLIAFFSRWKGRIFFGSDIVTNDAHLKSDQKKSEMAAKASSPDEAYDLYASRYWAFRTLFETSYDAESPIADPDLHMVEPARYSELDAPQLVGKNFPADILQSLYHDAADSLLGALE